MGIDIPVQILTQLAPVPLAMKLWQEELLPALGTGYLLRVPGCTGALIAVISLLSVPKLGRVNTSQGMAMSCNHTSAIAIS